VDSQSAESADRFRVLSLGDNQQPPCWVDNSFQALVGNFRGHRLVDSRLQHPELELVDILRAESWDSPDTHQAETAVQTGSTNINKTFSN